MGIEAFLFHELGVRPLFGNPTLIKDDNAVGISDR